jgi:serine/threonine protein kinase
MKRIGEYQITHANIAKGAFASIHKGKHIYSDQIVAIKEIKIEGGNIKNYIKREIEIHRSLDHPNIVSVLDVIYESNTAGIAAFIYIVMEYCQYGDLQKFQNKKPFSHKHIQNYMLQLRDALQYLRSKNIVHRDLKPQNILLISPIHIKITDFGLARYMHETDVDPTGCQDLFSTYCGSPIYMSPELLNHEQYNSKSDLWSLGIILYELITGTPPFIAKNLKQLIDRVNTERINLDKIDRTLITDDCFNLLCNLLSHDKTRRVGWDEFFSHKWFSNILILEDENKLIENPLCYDLLDSPQSSKNAGSMHNPDIRATGIGHDGAKSTSSSNSGLKFSDHLNCNSPKQERRHTSIDKSFTFSLKSSRIAEQSNHKELPVNQISLSDLVQDDIIAPSTQPLVDKHSITQIQSPSINNTPASKPINIVDNSRRIDRSGSRSPANSSGSSSSTSIPRGNIHNHKTGTSAPTHNIGNTQGTASSPLSLVNALRFIKETYDYLSSDNKSL